MPGRARQFEMVCALFVCALMATGCLSGTHLQNYGSTVVVPAEYATAPFEVTPTPVASSQPPLLALSPDASPNDTVLTGSTTIIDSSPLSDANAATSTARSSAGAPDLTYIYRRTAQSDDRDRNPVIVIPGVLGSRLVDQQSGQVVWGQFGGDSIDPHSPWGARMIALPMSQGQPLKALTDSVRAVGTLDALDVRLLGIPFQINAYRDLLNALGTGGYRDTQTNLAGIDYGDQSYSSFQFAYDWRRDNVENAHLLHQFILDKKAYVESERRKRYGDDFEPVRFDIVAHSMGGLVARYYLQYGDADLPADQTAAPITWAGAQNVARLIMVGTPNAGSVDAIANLVQGETLSRFLPRYEAAILGTMPALYQLLPRSRQSPVVAEGDRRAVDIMDPRVWGQFRWGLLDPRQQHIVRELLPEVADPQERHRIAYEHLTKCLARARAFHAAMDAPSKPPEGTTIHLIAGDAHPTITQYRADNRGALTMTAMQPGDGRVSRPSALMDERYSTGTKWTPRLVSPIKWTSVNFLFADHLGLTSDPGFTDNVLFLLLESPR